MSVHGADEHNDQRVLILAPVGKDAAIAREVLAGHGLPGVVCTDLAALCQEWDRGAGVLLIAEEAVLPDRLDCLSARIGEQPAWSDIPILVFLRGMATRQSIDRLRELRNVTLFERPIRIPALVSTVNTALRARRRQYEVRDLMMELREANRAKDDFLAIVSHELRTPLDVIQGLSRVLALGHAAPGRLAAAAETIGRNVNVVTRLVDDLLDVARLQKRQLSLNVAPMDLAAVITASVDLVRPSAEGKGVRITTDLVPPDAAVQGDAVRLQQVVSNLLSNAVKFTPADGTVTLTLRSAGGEAVITVSDTGVGVSPEFLPHIFEPFRQEHTTGSRHGGLGLGLSIVRQLVHLHGGTVSAHSHGPGQGTQLIVRLPLPVAVSGVAV
jgi:signal transduction histidine kinase